MSKTGRAITRRMSEGTLQKLRIVWEQSRDDDRALPWFVRVNSLYYHFKVLVKESGIKTGTSRYLRRSGASYCEFAEPGQGKHFLGHSTNGLAEKHYLSPSITAKQTPLPPSITSNSEPSIIAYDDGEPVYLLQSAEGDSNE